LLVRSRRSLRPSRVVPSASPAPTQADAYVSELARRQQRGIISAHTHLISVPDATVAGGGSGGATLNAILVIAEHLSARAGDTFINSAHLAGQAIILLHVGAQCPELLPAFVALPVVDEEGEGIANVDILLDNLASFAADSADSLKARAGIWICSSDGLSTTRVDRRPGVAWPKEAGITVLTVPCSLEVGSRHGVYQLDWDGDEAGDGAGDGAGGEGERRARCRRVTGIKFKQPIEDLAACCTIPADALAESRETGEKKVGDATAAAAATTAAAATVPLVGGLVHMDAAVASRLMALHTTPPYTSCTYLGADNGGWEIEEEGCPRFNFYLDVLAACCGDDREAFINAGVNKASQGGCKDGESKVQTDTAPPVSASASAAPASRKLSQTARGHLWDNLNGKVPVHAVLQHAASYQFATTASSFAATVAQTSVSTVRLMPHELLLRGTGDAPATGKEKEEEERPPTPPTLINSVLIGPGRVEDGAVLSHVHLARDDGHLRSSPAASSPLSPGGARASNSTSKGIHGAQNGWSIGAGSWAKGLRSFSGNDLAIPPRTFIQEISLSYILPTDDAGATLTLAAAVAGQGGGVDELSPLPIRPLLRAGSDEFYYHQQQQLGTPASRASSRPSSGPPSPRGTPPPTPPGRFQDNATAAANAANAATADAIATSLGSSLGSSFGGDAWLESARVLIVKGLDDNTRKTVDDPSATFLNMPWSTFFARTGVTPDDLWGGGGGDATDATDATPRDLHHARLYVPFDDSSTASGAPRCAVMMGLWMAKDGGTDPSVGKALTQWRAARYDSIGRPHKKRMGMNGNGGGWG
jgi:hypothetical protein